MLSHDDIDGIAAGAGTQNTIEKAPDLTPRQCDCLVLVAQGKSDWEIGQLLDISESTVHKHIEDAKRRYGVSTRIQLVVRALFHKRLRFGDVLGMKPAAGDDGATARQGQADS